MTDLRLKSSVLGLFDALFDIKPREFLRVQVFFFFLTTTSIFYTMGATVGDTLFLSRFGSEEAARVLPWVYIGAGLLTVALTWLYERAEERFSRERFVVGVNLTLAVSLLVFRWAIRSNQLWLYYALVIWLEACALLALMLFFSFAGDYFTSRDARRLYGYVNGGIAIGSILGGVSVEPLVHAIGDDNLLYVCAALLACGAFWCVLIPGIAKPVDEGGSEEREDSGLPLTAVLSDRFLQIVIVIVLASQACCWLVDYQLKIVASSTLKEEALAVFFGRFYTWLGVVQFVVQFGFVGWVLRRFGVVRSLTILPALLLASSATFFLHPVFMAAVAGNFIRLTFLETLDEPAQELLFLPLASRLRVRAQSFIEGMVLPMGICLAGVLLLTVSGAQHDVRRISVIAMALAVSWIAAILVLVPRYRETLAASLRRLGLDGGDLSSTLASVEGTAAVEDLLRSEQPERQILALDLWKGRPLGVLAPPVRRLIDSSSEAVAARAVGALAADKDPAHIPALEHALGDARADVRAAAISAYFEIDRPSAVQRLARWSEDPAAGVRVAVLAGSLAYGAREESGATLTRLAGLAKSADVSERLIAAKVLSRVAGHGTGRLFKKQLHDPAVEIRREVVLAVSAQPQADLAPWLVEQLRERELRPLAAAALENMPLSAVPAFIELIAQNDRPLEERALLTRILGRFGGLRGAKVLWDILASDEDVVLRVAAAETLLFMRSKSRALDLSRYQDEGFLARRLAALALINKARAQAGSSDVFFAEVLFDHARLEARAVLFAMALIQEERRIEHIEASLFGGTEAQKANALEIIEVIFPHDKASGLVAAIAPLVTEQHSAAGALAPDTIERLMRLGPWLSAAVRRHLDARGAEFAGEKKMSGNERYMYKLMSHISFLKETRLFEGVSANYLMSLAKILQERTFCKGEVLFSESQKADCFYFVREGAINVVVGGHQVSQLGPRETIGEMALIEGRPYAASAVAEGDLRVLRVSSEEFDNVLSTHPEITMALLRHVTARLRESLARAAA